MSEPTIWKVTDKKECEHEWRYMNTRREKYVPYGYTFGEWIFYDRFYCTKCLAVKEIKQES